MGAQLPADFLHYLGDGTDSATTDGAPGYFQLWPPDEIEDMNRAYRVAECAPGFIGFGSDGGGEMMAFDHNGAVFMIPFVGMSSKNAKKIGSSWSEIEARISQ